MLPITQLPSGGLRAGAVKVRRPRADTRVGRAKRRTLHGAEHSSKLWMRDGQRTPLERGRCREAPEDEQIRIPDDVIRALSTRVTRGQP